MSLRSLRALCLTSFFIADVRDGLGPFLGIFLTQRHWQAEDIGLLMTVGGVAGLLATLPAGFITDTSRHKRVLLAGVCGDHPDHPPALVQSEDQRGGPVTGCQRDLRGLCRTVNRRDHPWADPTARL